MPFLPLPPFSYGQGKIVMALINSKRQVKTLIHIFLALIARRLYYINLKQNKNKRVPYLLSINYSFIRRVWQISISVDLQLRQWQVRDYFHFSF